MKKLDHKYVHLLKINNLEFFYFRFFDYICIIYCIMEKRLLVIQEHSAKRAGLHWDVRFESGGDIQEYVEKRDPFTPEPMYSRPGKVLRSFVIPKHEFPEKGKFRMAILVEDHPWDYKDFDGIIPSGYGEGTVKLLFSDYIRIDEFNENRIKFEFDNKWYMIFKASKNYLIKQI